MSSCMSSLPPSPPTTANTGALPSSLTAAIMAAHQLQACDDRRKAKHVPPAVRSG